jgi:hypothetical protein
MEAGAYRARLDLRERSVTGLMWGRPIANLRGEKDRQCRPDDTQRGQDRQRDPGATQEVPVAERGIQDLESGARDQGACSDGMTRFL